MNNKSPYTDKPNRWSSHQLIAQLLEGLAVGSHVMDVGAGTGILARLCIGQGLFIRAIEPNIALIDGSSQYYNDVFAGNIEQASDTFLENNDAVVCADVLEHLVHPEEQLRRLVELQPDRCLFVISVPNVANIWVRLNLLCGRFNYTDRGILDKTHLHFYTRYTFLNLMKNSGLKVRAIHSTPIPLDLVHIFFNQNPIGHLLYSLLAQLTMKIPSLLGYQWVAEAYRLRE